MIRTINSQLFDNMIICQLRMMQIALKLGCLTLPVALSNRAGNSPAGSAQQIHLTQK